MGLREGIPTKHLSISELAKRKRRRRWKGESLLGFRRVAEHIDRRMKIQGMQLLGGRDGFWFALGKVLILGRKGIRECGEFGG